MKIIFVGNRRQVDERMNSLAGFQQRVEIADVTVENFIIILWLERLNVKEPQGKMFSQERNKVCADAPARTGDQDSFAHLSAVGGPRVSRPAAGVTWRSSRRQ